MGSMKRKSIAAVIISVFTAFSVLSAALAVFGNDITWSFDSGDGTLYIHGSSAMENYANPESAPWHMHMNAVRKAVISEGVQSIGGCAFAGMPKLESVVIPSTVKSINSSAMASCPMLKSLDLGVGISKIADASFAYMGNQPKQDFVVNTVAGSYALYYMIANEIPFYADSVTCGTYEADFYVINMKSYYPYTPKCDGTFTFYSTGIFDTVGRLYDSSMTQLKYSDDISDTNLNFSITADLKKGETYYISASMLNGWQAEKFSVTIEPVRFNVQGSIVAMADPTGVPSSIPVNDVLMDGERIGSSFQIDVSGGSATKAFCYRGVTRNVTFSPDSDSIVTIMTCDVNADGYVNAKDFAVMRKEGSAYLPLYKNFINYKVTP